MVEGGLATNQMGPKPFFLKKNLPAKIFFFFGPSGGTAPLGPHLGPSLTHTTTKNFKLDKFIIENK